MKLRQRKEYGIDISTRYMERDQKLEIMIVRWTWMSLMNSMRLQYSHKKLQEKNVKQTRINKKKFQ